LVGRNADAKLFENVEEMLKLKESMDGEGFEFDSTSESAK
jgi:hypothetical protein